MNKINRSKYIDNIEFFYFNLKKEDLCIFIHPTEKQMETG